MLDTKVYSCPPQVKDLPRDTKIGVTCRSCGRQWGKCAGADRQTPGCGIRRSARMEISLHRCSLRRYGEGGHQWRGAGRTAGAAACQYADATEGFHAHSLSGKGRGQGADLCAGSHSGVKAAVVLAAGAALSFQGVCRDIWASVTSAVLTTREMRGKIYLNARACASAELVVQASSATTSV